VEKLKDHYYDFYDFSPVGFVSLEQSGTIIQINLAGARLLGSERARLAGSRLELFMAGADRPVFNAFLQQVFTCETRQTCEVALTVEGKPPVFVQIEATLSPDRQECRSVVVDVTFRKQAENLKAKMVVQCKERQKTESLHRMAGAIAHNFNNLMAVVMGNLELSMDNLSRESDVGKKLTRAMKAASRAAEASGLILTYLGQTPGQRELLDLSETCRRSLTLLRAAMPKNVDLETDLPSCGPVIEVVAFQLIQVLTNLVTNAWEAIGEDPGAIQLRVKTVFPADIPATYRFPRDWQPEDNPYACLEVMDGGCGIAKQDIEKLFDPFFTNKSTGRGMGLPVVLGIVRAHHGVVTVESKANQGSAWRVFFPVSAKAIPRPKEFAATVSKIERGGTVLLIEDEQMVREMAKAMLTHLGFAVLEAKDGIEAVEVFRQNKDAICCVLCDLTMPRMGGWETLAVLRKLAPGIPVILSSGYDQAKVITGDHPERPQAFLGKPYRPTELRDAISQALENKQSGEKHKT
jgi:two-component system cell cycle sensor histidine kinase/response regulator CckA